MNKELKKDKMDVEEIKKELYEILELLDLEKPLPKENENRKESKSTN